MFLPKMCSIFYLAVCYASLLANLIHLGKKYFIFDIDTSVGFYSPINITSPNLSLCFDLNTIVGGYEPMMFYPKKAQYIGLKDGFLFSKVPRVDKILNKCAYRDAQLDQFKHVSNGSQCSSIFNINRYRMQNLMCYLFHLVQPHTFNFNALSFSVNEPRLLYKLVIDAPLNAAGHTVVPLVHFDELADVDRMFMSELFPSKRNNELYYLEYELFEIYRLPYPYTTNCGSEPHVRCYYNCMTRLFADIGLTTGSGISLETAATETSKVINNSFPGPKIKKLSDHITNLCLKKACTTEACVQKLLITYTSGPFESEADKLSFFVGSFKYPIDKIIHSAKFPLIEHLTHCFSLAGIWVGFSVIACITQTRKLDILSTFKKWQFIQAKLIRKLPVHPTFSYVRPVAANTKGKARIKLMRRTILVIFKLLVLLIFAVQAINLCVLYSRYQTVLHHEHIINPEYDSVLPSTVICIDLDELFFRQPQIITEDNFDRLWSGNTNLTVRQLLNGTMGEDILSNCRTRDYAGSDYYIGIFQLKSRNQCLKEFKFRRYYSNWQVCYVFKPSLPKKHLQWEFVFRETNPSKLYSLILNPKVKHFRRLDLILFYPDDSLVPYTSDEYLAISHKISNKRVVMLTSRTRIRSSLPSPYDTKCSLFAASGVCREQCFASGLSQFNLIPYQHSVSQKFDSKLFRYKHMKNASLYKYWLDLERKCHLKCLLNLCKSNFSMTYARNFPGKTEFNVEILVKTEVGPRIRSLSLARFPFIDFYYQMFCLLTFWLDFSFVGLDMIRKRREKLISKNVKLLYAKSMKLLLELLSVTNTKASIDLRRKSLFNKSFIKIICVIGMCIHLAMPFMEYFAYPTMLLTTVYLERPSNYMFSLCSEAQEIFEKGIVFRTEKAQKQKLDIFNKNIDEILGEAEKSIETNFLCGYWGLARDRNKSNDMARMTDRIFFETDNSSLCHEMFRTRTSLVHGHVCLQFELGRVDN